MNTIIVSFLITTLAGFATMLGVIPIFFHMQKEKIIPVSLAFSAGVMLCISLLSLIPEAASYMQAEWKQIYAMIGTGVFLGLGILFSAIIDSKIDQKISSNALYRLGIISVIALMLHNIPEGITTFISSHHDLSLGITLSIGIALHNIPEGISIAIPIYYATKNKKKAIFLTFISGFSELLGAILAYLFLAPYITSFSLGIILSVTAGIMIHISCFELLPTAWKYASPIRIIIAFLFGFYVMILCHDFLVF